MMAERLVAECVAGRQRLLNVAATQLLHLRRALERLTGEQCVKLSKVCA